MSKNKVKIQLAYIFTNIGQKSRLFGFRLVEKIRNNDTMHCIPMKFSSLLKDIKPICTEFNSSYKDIMRALYYDPEVYECKKSCVQFEYHGEHEPSSNPLSDLDNRTIGFHFFMKDSHIHKRTEYLVYDLNGLIGFVGGTLGLFVGFSIFNFVEQCLGYFKRMILKYTS